jgi:hypothetical protein
MLLRRPDCRDCAAHSAGNCGKHDTVSRPVRHEEDAAVRVRAEYAPLVAAARHILLECEAECVCPLCATVRACGLHAALDRVEGALATRGAAGAA